MARVLCTGVDPALLKTRRMMLEAAGHKVTSAQGIPAVEAACKQHKFQVAVLGQAMSREEKRTLADIVRRQCPGARLLELYDAVGSRTLPDADDWLPVPTDVPQELPERVSSLAARPPS